jgi:hypothetical protein
MADSSWDNSGKAPVKTGLSPLAMLLAGSGVGVVLLLLVALGFGAAAIHKANQSRTAALEQTWSIIQRAVQRLESEGGAGAYYRENPGLADRYPTEAAFVTACTGWIPKLKALPNKPPEALGAEGLEFSFNQRGGTNSYLSYRLPHQVGVFRFATQDGRVVGLSVD